MVGVACAFHDMFLAAGLRRYFSHLHQSTRRRHLGGVLVDSAISRSTLEMIASR